MIRAVIALIAVSLVIAVLIFLTLESRSVNEAQFLRHTEQLRLIDEIRDGLGVTVAGAEAALLQGRDTPEDMIGSLYRLEASREALQERMTGVSPQQQPAVAEVDAALAGFVSRGWRMIEQIDAVDSSIAIVQEDSADVIRALRDNGLLLQSRAVFSLTHDLMGYATGSNDIDAAELAARIDTLAEDPGIAANAPGAVDDFAEAYAAVIAERELAAGTLEELRDSPTEARLGALAGALVAEHRAAVSRAERARLLLSVSTLVLLAGVGFAVLRLQASYRELNKSNAELARINESLEERVTERTRELSSAYEELKDSQVQLVQAEKMSSLGELVAGISHEINTPLWYLINNATTVQERLRLVQEFADTGDTMIRALSENKDARATLSAGLKNMRRMLRDGLKDDIEEAVELIDDSVEGLEELTQLAQSLKDFSRLDRAQSGRFNVNEGIEKTLLIARNRLKGRIEIEKELGDVPEIACAPSQINQVFLNLITNAADAIEAEGTIRITTSSEDEFVRVRIADTGCGIPEDQLDRIRDPFFTTKEVGKGTGLGMSIVDRIVDAHNGRLDIESTVGEGTVVTVRLPVEPSARAETAAAGIDAATDESMTAAVDSEPREAKAASA